MHKVNASLSVLPELLLIEMQYLNICNQVSILLKGLSIYTIAEELLQPQIFHTMDTISLKWKNFSQIDQTHSSY